MWNAYWPTIKSSRSRSASSSYPTLTSITRVILCITTAGWMAFLVISIRQKTTRKIYQRMIELLRNVGPLYYSQLKLWSKLNSLNFPPDTFRTLPWHHRLVDGFQALELQGGRVVPGLPPGQGPPSPSRTRDPGALAGRRHRRRPEEGDQLRMSCA